MLVAVAFCLASSYCFLLRSQTIVLHQSSDELHTPARRPLQFFFSARRGEEEAKKRAKELEESQENERMDVAAAAAVVAPPSDLAVQSRGREEEEAQRAAPIPHFSKLSDHMRPKNIIPQDHSIISPRMGKTWCSARRVLRWRAIKINQRSERKSREVSRGAK
jgi:hypothetical protein